MQWIDAFRLSEIHREVYIAILKSWIPHGQREEFAHQCGITREYLSCLCALDNQVDGTVPIHKRYPSFQLARKMEKYLPAPEEIRRSLLENIELTHINAVKAHYFASAPLELSLVRRRLTDVEELSQQATFGKDPGEVKLAYRVVRNASHSLIHQIDPEECPDSFAAACLCYHDSQCVLDRPDEALRYAKLGQIVLESSEKVETGYTKERRDNLETNAIRGEAVAYHNLRLDRKALPILAERACRTSAYRNAKSFWEPIISRDLINSMVEIPRFSIRDAGRAVRQGELTCEHSGDGLNLSLLHEAWLRCLVANKRWKQAQKIFYNEIADLPHLSRVGPLHKVLLFKVGAQSAWGSHDLSAWKYLITETVNLAYQAGLNHQLVSISQYYGLPLKSILAELGIQEENLLPT